MAKTNPISVIRIAIGFFFIITQSILFTPLFLIMLPSRHYRIRLGNLYGKTVAPFVFFALGVRLKINNEERLSQLYPAIYLSNHSSQIDPVIAIKLTPFGGCGVAKKEIASIPFFGWSYRMSGHLLIDRGDREKAIASLEDLNQAVQSMNLGVWIWPEGTRSKDGRLLRFKKGFAHIALATKLPIVPLIVKGAHKRWPSRSFRINPGSIEIDVLEAISTKDWNIETLDKHIEEIRNIYLQHLPEDQLPLPT